MSTTLEKSLTNSIRAAKSLGGSLMKDLWADLQVDGEDDGMGWSLEQLEKELARLDDDELPGTTPVASSSLTYPSGPTPPSSSAAAAAAAFSGAPLGLSAASVVVSHQKDSLPAFSAPMQQLPPPTASQPVLHFQQQQRNVGGDAWSKSLEKFTASSLEKDFLAADSARKQVRPAAPPGFLADAEEYNVAEQLTLAPPPGMAAAAATGRASKPPGLPQRTIIPKTPQNSLSQIPIDPTNNNKSSAELLSSIPIQPLPTNTPHNSLAQIPIDDLPAPSTMTPQNSLAVLPEQDLPVVMEKPPPFTPANSMAQLPEDALPKMPARVPPTPQNSMTMLIPPPVPPTPRNSVSGVVMPPGSMPPPHPNMPPPSGVAFPVAAPMMPNKPPAGAWQQQRQQPQARPPQQPTPAPKIRVYCEVHPSAPPIPASSVKTSIMTPRDIAYVVHSILKPILLSGTSPSDYHMRYFAAAAEASTPTKNKQDLVNEAASRLNKTKEWMKDKGTLGHVSKTDVSRPRALLATPTLVSEEDVEQKQRASLWKARLHIDQGYQACSALVEIWQATPPGTVPPQVQHHLLKLFKCLGMAVDKDGVYSVVKEESLRVVLKMSKGRVFVARLLEQALLPPGAVQVLLPTALRLAVEVGTPNDPTDNRVFGSMGRVVTTLAHLEPACIVKSVEAVHSKQALTSQARMVCVHALLQRGNVMAANNPSFLDEWKQTEAKFTALLE